MISPTKIERTTTAGSLSARAAINESPERQQRRVIDLVRRKIFPAMSQQQFYSMCQEKHKEFGVLAQALANAEQPEALLEQI